MGNVFWVRFQKSFLVKVKLKLPIYLLTNNNNKLSYKYKLLVFESLCLQKLILFKLEIIVKFNNYRMYN
jgi:hypothetical protein